MQIKNKTNPLPQRKLPRLKINPVKLASRGSSHIRILNFWLYVLLTHAMSKIAE